MADSLNNFSKEIIFSWTGWQHILDALYLWLLLITGIKKFGLQRSDAPLFAENGGIIYVVKINLVQQ